MNLSPPQDLPADGSIVAEPIALTIGFDAGAQPKSFKDTAWKLTGGLKPAASGAELPLEDPLVLGETLPQPTQAADGAYVLTVAPASAGVLTLKLALTGPKDFLLEAPPVQVTIQPPPTRQELFQKAVASADEETVARMLGEGPDEGEAWSWLNTKSGTPLLALLGAAPAADEEARLKLLTLLLEAGADVPATPARRGAAPSALHCAIYAGEKRMLSALLERASAAELATLAASPKSGRVGFTPLHAACEVGDAAAAASLIARGSPLEGPLGTPSPLALCAERADLGMTKQLLGAAADGAARARLLAVGTLDAAHSALALANAAAAAKPAEAEELVRFLLDQHGAVGCLGFSSQAPEQEEAAEAEAMLAAAGHGLHVVVRQLLLRGVDATTPHPDGRSALHDAVAGGHIETARALLDAGADPNGRAHGGAAETELPLLLAVILPELTAAREMARLLRIRGADAAMRDSEGRDAPALAKLWRPNDTALIDELSRPLPMPSLPAGWLEAVDKTGRPFYFHARTKEARWEPPLLPIA